MRPFMQLVLMMSLAAAASQQVTAFSLAGPDTTWMTVRLGYDTAVGLEPAGQGGAGFAGPMNIGEDYRINYPTVTWGCSPTFLNYFGLRGLQEIQKAVDILNALPSADTVNINDYPTSAQRINYRAQALGLFDLKSIALSVLVNHMGLTDPTRFVFTLRERWIGPIPGPTNYYVIKRNLDPDTWVYSSYINGQLWTYTTIGDGDTRSVMINEPVDPAAFGGAITAPVASGFAGFAWLLMGGFWTGLTRDDVGGLRYIYRHNNFNNETAPTNSVLGGSGAVVAGGRSSPWTIPNFGTNTTGTGGTVIPGQGTNIVNFALRPGVGKVQFVHMIEESQVGSFISNTVTWVDTFLTNGVSRSQNLVRTATAPDVLFDAGDINGADTGTPNGFFGSGAFAPLAWQSTGNGTTTYGPGTIPPAVNATPALAFTFNDVGPTYANVFQGSPLLSESNASRFFLYGSFDGSAVDPIVYPQTESIQAIEQMVIGGGAGGVGGGITGPQVGIWTPASLILLPVGTTPGGGTGPGTGTGTGGGAGAGGTGGTGG
jgi:hypothetical protein